MTDVPPVVRAAQEVHAGERTLSDFVAVFCAETVYLQRPENPGLFVATIGGEQWVSVFSTAEKMHRFTGSTYWASLSGADLSNSIHVGVNLLLDPGDAHSVAIESVNLPRSLLADEQ